MRRLQHLVQRFGNHSNARFHTLTNVTTRMHVVHLARSCLHALQIVGQHLTRKVAGGRLIGARIQRVRRVRQKRGNAVFGCHLLKRCNIRWVNGLSLATARIPREKLKRIGANPRGVTRHSRVAL